MIENSRALPAFAAATGATLGALLARAAERLVVSVLAWHERAAQRRALMAMDDRALKDIGISRADVEMETRKPFWRV